MEDVEDNVIGVTSRTKREVQKKTAKVDAKTVDLVRDLNANICKFVY